MVNNNFTAIVIVAVVVALVASFATASIVGNTIRVNPDKLGGYQVYIKAEIDKRLAELPSYRGIEEKCEVFKDLIVLSDAVKEGETTKLHLGLKDYTVGINFVGISTTKLNVNGETTDTLSVGETQKLSDGAIVQITGIDVQDYAGGMKRVEFSISTETYSIEC